MPHEYRTLEQKVRGQDPDRILDSLLRLCRDPPSGEPEQLRTGKEENFPSVRIIMGTVENDRQEKRLEHRHLTHSGFTLAAIDDVIRGGRWRDWAELRRAALADRSLIDKIERVCRPYAGDPYAQRYHFWMHYVEEHRSIA